MRSLEVRRTTSSQQVGDLRLLAGRHSQPGLAGRVYCYSSDDSDSEVPLHQRIKRSRFVSRIQEERIHFQSEKLDLEQFQEKVRNSRFVVVVEDSMPGSGIVIRLDSVSSRLLIISV